MPAGPGVLRSDFWFGDRRDAGQRNERNAGGAGREGAQGERGRGAGYPRSNVRRRAARWAHPGHACPRGRSGWRQGTSGQGQRLAGGAEGQDPAGVCGRGLLLARRLADGPADSRGCDPQSQRLRGCLVPSRLDPLPSGRSGRGLPLPASLRHNRRRARGAGRAGRRPGQGSAGQSVAGPGSP